MEHSAESMAHSVTNAEQGDKWYKVKGIGYKVKNYDIESRKRAESVVICLSFPQFCRSLFTLNLIPYTLHLAFHPMPYALCPMRYAPCALRQALCHIYF